ncbi:MAG TPA: dihydroorotase [Flavitalea sp.]|nr:dihydroorotase [Flavitalea sp.]
MTVLIKQARIIDPSSPYNETRQDILIESGIIKNIGNELNSSEGETFYADDLHVSPGWVDIFANFSDPGYEFRETLESGSRAAAAGGFTDVFLVPNTKPVTDNKSQVEYLNRKSGSLAVNIHPIGAISKNTEGKDLAEMYDMRNSGAIAFSDGINPVQSAGLLLKALQYVKAFDGVVIQIPDDKSVGANGLVHEGIVSTRLGLAGKPMMAEELLVARDIKLARYTESKLHFTGVTSPRSIDYIKRAKDAGLPVTCSVTPYHLFFTDEDLKDYDTNLKVYPPLRSAAEQSVLLNAVTDGTIDCIATHHMPHDYDSKVLEFEYAKNGMTGLETCYAVLKTILPAVSEKQWVDLLSLNARKIFGLEHLSINKNEKATLTLFSPGGKTKIASHEFYSRSVNTPFAGKELSGSVLGTIQNNKLFIRNKNK